MPNRPKRPGKGQQLSSGSGGSGRPGFLQSLLIGDIEPGIDISEEEIDTGTPISDVPEDEKGYYEQGNKKIRMPMATVQGEKPGFFKNFVTKGEAGRNFAAATNDVAMRNLGVRQSIARDIFERGENQGFAEKQRIAGEGFTLSRDTIQHGRGVEAAAQAQKDRLALPAAERAAAKAALEENDRQRGAIKLAKEFPNESFSPLVHELFGRTDRLEQESSALAEKTAGSNLRTDEATRDLAASVAKPDARGNAYIDKLASTGIGNRATEESIAGAKQRREAFRTKVELGTAPFEGVTVFDPSQFNPEQYPSAQTIPGTPSYETTDPVTLQKRKVAGTPAGVEITKPVVVGNVNDKPEKQTRVPVSQKKPFVLEEDFEELPKRPYEVFIPYGRKPVSFRQEEEKRKKKSGNQGIKG